MKSIHVRKQVGFSFVMILILWGVLKTVSAADLTLEKAIETALANNPGLQAAGFGAEAAKEKTVQAGSGAYPQVSLNGGYSRTTNPMWAFGTKLNQEAITARDFDPARLNDPAGIDNFGSSLSVVWPVYDQGRTWYGLQQARMNEESLLLLAERARQEVIAGTTAAYVGALLARENETVVRKAVETAKSHMNLIQSRYEGGFVAKSDLLRAQVHMADLTQQLSEARSGADIAQCRLAVAMGTAGETDMNLITPLEPGKPVHGDPEAWIAKAQSGRPDLKSVFIRKSMAEKEVKKARAAHYPAVNLTGNYEVNSEALDDHGKSYTVGAAVSLPLFSGGRISAAVREAELGLKQAHALHTGLSQQVCGETRQAFFNARSAWERISVADTAVNQSEESLRIVRNRYNSGLFTITDLLDAEVAVQQSLTNRLKAIHDYRAAAARLFLAAGMVESD